jgi:hypothetical protein
MQHFIQRRSRQRLHIGKALHETLVVRDDGADLRLLQHDFRNPHAIGVLVLLPRQVLAPGLIEPLQQ